MKERARGWLDRFKKVATTTAVIAATGTIPALRQDIGKEAMMLIKEDQAEKMPLFEIIKMNASITEDGLKKTEKLEESLQKVASRHEALIQKTQTFTDNTLTQLAGDVRNQGEFAEENYERGQGSVLELGGTGKYNCESFSIFFAMELEDLIKKLPAEKQKDYEIGFLFVDMDGIPHQKVVLKQVRDSNKIYTHIDQKGVEAHYLSLRPDQGAYLSLADFKKCLAGYDVIVDSHFKADNEKNVNVEREGTDAAQWKLRGQLPPNPQKNAAVNITNKTELQNYLETLEIKEGDKISGVGKHVNLEKMTPSVEMAKAVANHFNSLPYRVFRSFNIGDIHRWPEDAAKVLLRELKDIEELQLETSTGTLPEYLLDFVAHESAERILTMSIFCSGKRLTLQIFRKISAILPATKGRVKMQTNYTSLTEKEIKAANEENDMSIEIDGRNLTPDIIKKIRGKDDNNDKEPIITIPHENYLTLLRNTEVAKALAENVKIMPQYASMPDAQVIQEAYILSFYNTQHPLVEFVRESRHLSIHFKEKDKNEYEENVINTFKQAAEALGIRPEDLKMQLGWR